VGGICDVRRRDCAMAVIDACVRLLPGRVDGKLASGADRKAFPTPTGIPAIYPAEEFEGQPIRRSLCRGDHEPGRGLRRPESRGRVKRRRGGPISDGGPRAKKAKKNRKG